MAQSEGTFFIGIAGPSCSGKSTFTDALATGIGVNNVEVVHADDYWNQNFTPPVVNGYKNREIPESIRTDLLFSHLRALRNGETVEILHRSFEIEGNTREALPRKFVIVEGFLLLYEERIRSLFDLKLFLDLEEDEIVRRRLQRNRSGKRREEYYRTILLSEYRKYGLLAKKYADVILDGTRTKEENIRRVLEKIENI